MSTTIDIPPSHFGRRLQALRAEKGWTLYRLAQECTRLGYPITDTALSRLEGEARPYLDTAHALALVLGVDVREFLDPGGPRSPRKKS